MLKKFLLLSVFSSLVLGTAYAQIMNSERTEEQPEEAPVFLADYDVTQAEYKKCTSKVISGSAAGYIACLNAEIKRQHKDIEKFYRIFLEDERFQTWNGGNTLSQGNFKDMNEALVAYRDRLCSLSALGMMSLYGNIEWGKKECILNFNTFVLGQLQQIKEGAFADFPREGDEEGFY